MRKKKKKNSLKEIKKLDAKTFLSHYYGISDEEVENMTHLVLSEFFPQLKRTSFGYVQKNPELVTRGEIVLVEDSKHYQVPYWKPKQSIIDDLLLFCDNRERVIHEIINLLRKAMENNLEALFIIEVEKELDSYLYKGENVSDNFLLENNLNNQLVKKSAEKTGLIIKKDYSVLGYRILNHGDNYYSTCILPPLQRQAVGISRKTDAFAILYEEGKLLLAIDGVLKEIPNEYVLHKTLMLLFPLEESKEKKSDEKNILEVPDLNSYHFREMSNHELEMLMKTYRISNQMAYYHAVRRELVMRTKISKNYRIQKEKKKQKKLREED